MWWVKDGTGLPHSYLSRRQMTLESGLISPLAWNIECGRSDAVPVPGLTLKRTVSFSPSGAQLPWNDDTTWRETLEDVGYLGCSSPAFPSDLSLYHTEQNYSAEPSQISES